MTRVAGSAVYVEILEPGPRAEELVRSLAETLERRPNRKTDAGALFWFSATSAQSAWETTVDAVNAAGEDWADHLRLSVPPELNYGPHDPPPHPACSFCGKPERIVEKLIAGPGVYICDECVALCVEILDAGRGARPVPGDD